MTDRAQHAAETILTDPSLTDNLDDQPAQVLIDWGVQVAKRTAKHTEDMNDEAAQGFIDKQMTDLRKFMRRVNKLYGSYTESSPEEIISQIERIYDSTHNIRVIESRPIPDRKVIAESIYNLAPSDSIRQILGPIVILGEVHEEFQQEEGLVLEEITEQRNEGAMIQSEEPPIETSPGSLPHEEQLNSADTISSGDDKSGE